MQRNLPRLLLLLAVLTCPACAGGDPITQLARSAMSGKLIVAGKVVDEQGNPMPNAKVRWQPVILGWDLGPPTQDKEAKVRKDGSFYINPGRVAGVELTVHAGAVREYFGFHRTYYAMEDRSEDAIGDRVQSKLEGKELEPLEKSYENLEIVMIKRGPFTTLIAQKLLLEYRSDGSGRVGLLYAKPGEIEAHEEGRGPAVLEYTEVPDVEAAVQAAEAGEPLEPGGRPVRGIIFAKPEGYQPGKQVETGYFNGTQRHDSPWLEEANPQRRRMVEPIEHPRHPLLMVAGPESGIQSGPSEELESAHILDLQTIMRRAPEEGYARSVAVPPSAWGDGQQCRPTWSFLKIGDLYGWSRVYWPADPVRKPKIPYNHSRRRFERADDGWTYRLPILIFIQPDGSRNLEERNGLRCDYWRIEIPPMRSKLRKEPARE